MAEAVMSFTVLKPQQVYHKSSFQTTKLDLHPSSKSLRQISSSGFTNGLLQHSVGEDSKRRRGLSKVNAIPDWTLMTVLVEHIDGQRDMITHKFVWHLNDTQIKNVYGFYLLFIGWGCCVFGSTKDPHYDSEQYRKDGGDGSGHWIYDKQADIEERARAELWREELLEEIEQKVGGLRELEEAKEEEFVK